MTVQTCRRCGLTQFTGVAGYIGPACKCVVSTLAPTLPDPTYSGFRWPEPLTEQRVREIVREIVREELELTKGEP